MSTGSIDCLDGLTRRGVCLEDEVAEVVLLLPGWQVRALEKAAHERGLTSGQLARHLLRTFLETESITRTV